MDRQGEEVRVSGGLGDQGVYQPLPFLYVRASLVLGSPHVIASHPQPWVSISLGSESGPLSTSCSQARGPFGSQREE